MKSKEFKRNFILKGIVAIALIASVVTMFAYSVADLKLEQDVKHLEKRTTLQINIEKERLSSWLGTLEHYGDDFVNAEPLRTFVVALANSESIEKNKAFLEQEKVYIQTVLDGFLYQNSLKSASLIAGTGEVFLYSGFNGNLSKLQKQTALAVIAESKLKYIPVREDNGNLYLEVFKPIYGFVVDDLPVSVLHMVIKLDRKFVDLITKDLPVEGSEQIILWQEFNKLKQAISYNAELDRLELVKIKDYEAGFISDKENGLFLNTVEVKDAPFSITLIAKKKDSLKTYNTYVKNLRVIVVLVIIMAIMILWVLFTKVVLRKYRQELRFKEMLTRQSEKTVGALVKTLELRDPYLAGHYSNVKDMAIKVATEMELSDEELSTLRHAALLAGIGKIAIPKSILTKPEKLTEEETKIMQSHVNFAEEILEDMEFELPIKDVVSQMYERLDGTGYPRGLSGTDISKLSRILAVCDVFCALKSPRAYREGKSEQQALEIMQKDIALFDADVLSMLFKVINK